MKETRALQKLRDSLRAVVAEAVDDGILTEAEVLAEALAVSDEWACRVDTLGDGE